MNDDFGDGEWDYDLALGVAAWPGVEAMIAALSAELAEAKFRELSWA